MRSSTNEFLTAARANPRQCAAKLEVYWTNPMIDPSITVTSSDNNRGSLLNQVYDSKTEVVRNWAHLDGLLKPNGTFNPAPGDSGQFGQVGWWGATRCNSSSVWPGANPELYIQFDARPILALMVSGESNYNEYPVDFDIHLFSGAGGSTLEHTEVVTGNTDLIWTKSVASLGLNNITKMTLEIKTWSTPERVVKITEFYTSFYQVIENEDIVKMDLLEERLIADGSLPVGNISANEIDITLQNISTTLEGSEIIDPFFPDNPDSPYNTLLTKNRKMIPHIGFVLEDGSTEYIKLGAFWTGDWDVNEQSATCSVSARDRMELLRSAEYKGSTLYEDTTLYDLMLIVLEDAKANIPMEDLLWSVDTSLQNYPIPYAWFPKKSYFNTIKDIVTACMGQAYMDRDDVLIIEGPEQLTSY